MQQEPGLSFWNTCYNANGIHACATFGAGFTDGSPDAPYPYSEPNQFIGAWVHPTLSFDGTQPFRITAWGLKWDTPAVLDMYYGDAGSASNPPR